MIEMNYDQFHNPYPPIINGNVNIELQQGYWHLLLSGK